MDLANAVELKKQTQFSMRSNHFDISFPFGIEETTYFCHTRLICFLENGIIYIFLSY